MKKLFEAIIKGTGNMIFICIVAFVVVTTIYFCRRNVVNDVNRIYASYDRIQSIHTDYTENKMYVVMAGESVFEPTHELVFDLNKVYDSDMVVVDNSMFYPTPVDNVLHIPDTYNWIDDN